MTTQNILPLIQRQGSTGIVIGQIMSAAGISPKTARRLLHLLLDAGQIKQERTGNTVHYIATEHYVPRLVIKKGPPGRPRHDIAKISSVSGRSANISPERLAIEEILAEATGPLQRGIIAAKLGITGERCKNILQRMAREHKASCTTTGWVGVIQKPKDEQQRPTRVCNSSQPNGDMDYWRRYTANTMSMGAR